MQTFIVCKDSWYIYYRFHYLRELKSTDLLVKHVLVADLLGGATSAVAFARGILLSLIFRNMGERAGTLLVRGAHLLRGALGRRGLTLLSVCSNHLQYVCVYQFHV